MKHTQALYLLDLFIIQYGQKDLWKSWNTSTGRAFSTVSARLFPHYDNHT